MSFVSLSMLILTITPTYFIILKREPQLMLPIILPFIDPDTNRECFINLVHQLGYAIVGPFGILGIDLTTVMNKHGFVMAVAISY